MTLKNIDIGQLILVNKAKQLFVKAMETSPPPKKIKRKTQSSDEDEDNYEILKMHLRF
jgi:hypothetical protein